MNTPRKDAKFVLKEMFKYYKDLNNSNDSNDLKTQKFMKFSENMIIVNTPGIFDKTIHTLKK